MTDMNPVATAVLNALQNSTPEVLFLMYQHELLDTWSDTGKFVSTREEMVSTTQRIAFLASLYDPEWAAIQCHKIRAVLVSSPDVFKKVRALEGMEQWEFDLLSHENDHLINLE